MNKERNAEEGKSSRLPHPINFIPIWSPGSWHLETWSLSLSDQCPCLCKSLLGLLESEMASPSLGTCLGMSSGNKSVSLTLLGKVAELTGHS